MAQALKKEDVEYFSNVSFINIPKKNIKKVSPWTHYIIMRAQRIGEKTIDEIIEDAYISGRANNNQDIERILFGFAILIDDETDFGDNFRHFFNREKMKFAPTGEIIDGEQESFLRGILKKVRDDYVTLELSRGFEVKEDGGNTRVQPNEGAEPLEDDKQKQGGQKGQRRRYQSEGTIRKNLSIAPSLSEALDLVATQKGVSTSRLVSEIAEENPDVAKALAELNPK